LVQLFGEHPDLSGVVDAPWFSFECPALVHAAGCRDRALLDTLIDLGADIEARSDWDAGPYTAMHRLVDGATSESLELAEHLEHRGAEIDLHAAAGLGRIDRIKELLTARPDRVSEAGPDGATPLHLARDVATAELLLECGAEIDKRCVDHSSTPAMWAVQGREEVMRYLVGRGARPDLYLAVLLDDVALVEQLLEADPGAIDVRVRFGESHEHVGMGDKYVWALHGADTPVELARRRDKAETYSFLLSRSPMDTQAVQASRRGDRATLNELLQSPDALSHMPDARICEALYGSEIGAEMLLEAGADPNARDDQTGATALHHAAWRGLTQVLSKLLDAGADASIRDHHYDASPLGWAHENNQSGALATLRAHRPPDIVDAAWLGDADRVAQILESDPSLVNGLEGGRISPLRSAAWCGKVEVVQLLLRHGADSSLVHPASGKTALDLAQEQGHDAIVRLLSNR
jgi:ankyrin repeat protein